MLPLVAIGLVSLVCGGAGAKKIADGVSNSGQAKRVSSAAALRLESAKKRLAKKMKAASRRLELLAEKRENARSLIVDDLSVALSRIAAVADSGWSDISDNVDGPATLSATLQTVDGHLTGALRGGVTGAGVGYLVGQQAASFAVRYGVASTGASISTLSGAAATNSTLAYLGGGAISAGGLGVAGGAIALNALIAGPALLLGALKYAGKAEEQLTAARAFEAKVATAVASAKESEARLKAIGLRADEVADAITSAGSRATTAATELNRKLDALGIKDPVAFTSLAPDSQTAVLLLSALTGTLCELVEVDIHDEAGALIESSADVVKRAKALMEAA